MHENIGIRGKYSIEYAIYNSLYYVRIFAGAYFLIFFYLIFNYLLLEFFNTFL